MDCSANAEVNVEALQPAVRLEYDIEADWQLLSRCNFSCEYCNAPEGRGRRPPDRRGTAAEWVRGFGATGRTWLLHLTGGEPGLHPELVELCAGLTAAHYLSLNTNLSCPSLEEFAERIDPSRVHFINAALHASSRPGPAAIDQFVERFRYVRSRGFLIFASQLMTPEIIPAFDRWRADLADAGIRLYPKVLRGPYRDRIFPASYSSAERDRLHALITAATDDFTKLITPLDEAPTVDLRRDAIQVDGRPDYRGRWCCPGWRLVRIRPDGAVYRCGRRKPIGNILDEKLQLLDGPRVCTSRSCPYFCEKHTTWTARSSGRQNRFGLHRVLPGLNRRSPVLGDLACRLTRAVLG